MLTNICCYPVFISCCVTSRSYLQVAVPAAGAAPALAQVTPGRTVEEVAVVVAAAVLVQDVPHLWLEERHVHVDRHDLQETRHAQKCLRCSDPTFSEKS